MLPAILLVSQLFTTIGMYTDLHRNLLVCFMPHNFINYEALKHTALNSSSSSTALDNAIPMQANRTDFHLL